jgi:hypothetical protein
MFYTYFGDIPKHQYCYVLSEFISENKGEVWACVWFGIVSQLGRAWGLNVLLESGAVYRNLPPHAIRFGNKQNDWTIEQAQLWDCYSQDFAVIEYKFLKEMGVFCRVCGETIAGQYLFTAAFLNNGFSEEPTQNKEFIFVKLDNGCLTVQPTNKVLFYDKSFVEIDEKNVQFPNNLRLQSEKWSVE